MSSHCLRIRYRDFYDVPRAILVERGGTVYFFDCPFSDELDDYADVYRVYQLPQTLSVDLDLISWENLPSDGTFIGSVPVGSVKFDRTRRRLLKSDVLDRLKES